jgi:hypothetical protein
MTVQIFRSTDPGAPVLHNTAGSMIGVLDYCLVTGLGWTKAVLGTNQASYTQPAGSNGFYMQVDDTSTTTTAITAYETLTAFNTGTNEWHPTAGRVQLAKNPLSLTSVAWKLVSNGSLFHLIVIQSPASQYADLLTFGDIVSYSSGTDTHATVLMGAAAYSNNLSWVGQLSSSYKATATFSSVDRSYDQTTLNPTTSIPSLYEISYSGGGSSGLPYPNCDGTLRLAPVWLAETAHSYRGLIPGVWIPCHPAAFQTGDTFTISSGPLAGRSFDATYASNVVLLETSNTWGGF